MVPVCKIRLQRGLLILSACVLAAAAGCSNRQGQARLEWRSLASGGTQRTYFLLEPQDVEQQEGLPLVLALHGGGGNARAMCRLKGGVQEQAPGAGFLVACPQGIDRHWNDGRQVTSRRTVREGTDDVGFLLDLVAVLQAEFHIDARRVYVTGMSNGGMMSLRMACDAAETFAAAAAVIANLPADLECAPQAPVSLLLMNGTEDPLVPWEGGQVHFLRQRLGNVLSTAATLATWVQADDCDGPARTAWLPDADPGDGTRIRSERYSDCAGGSHVWLYAVEGGGHTWPGGAQYAPRLLVGRVSRDARAGELIWDFFRTMSRP